jgi:hypothetical protein
VLLKDTNTGSTLNIIPVTENSQSKFSSNQHQFWGWSASQYSMENLESCNHNYELVPDPNGQVHVHVDRYMMGLGGYDSWSPNVSEDFLVRTGCISTGTIILSPNI